VLLGGDRAVPCCGDRQRQCKQSEEGDSAHGNYLPKATQEGAGKGLPKISVRLENILRKSTNWSTVEDERTSKAR
jgi:hypothetical protein